MLLLGWSHEGRCRWQRKPGCALPQQTGSRLLRAHTLVLLSVKSARRPLDTHSATCPYTSSGAASMHCKQWWAAWGLVCMRVRGQAGLQ